MLAASGNGQTDLESDITRLKAWYQTLDNELQATISAFSHKDLRLLFEADLTLLLNGKSVTMEKRS